MILALSIAGVLFALLPAAVFMANLPLFKFDQAIPDCEGAGTPVSVLIPARDEELSIGRSIEAALSSNGVSVEVVVLDDDSQDATADVVRRYADSDIRVRYVAGKPLPAEWNGKQHACKQLAGAASHERLLFVDADVRLEPMALVRLVAYQDEHDLALLSAFPRQETGTWLEKWIIPLMHFILLGFLPMARMRSSTHPAYAAGCGQLFMTRRDDYERAGTHARIHDSRHDGVKLPRIYRHAGLMTDVVDGTELARCRMYHNASEVIRGVLKNAVEGIANPRLITFFSVVLIGGSVMPVVTFALAISTGHHVAAIVSLVGVILGHLPRALAAVHFRQSVSGVLFHSPATLVFVSLQWMALAIRIAGRKIAWRGRTDT